MHTPPKIGVIMLNTDFPRLLGDIGNPASFNCACEIIRLEQCRVANIVTEHIAPELADEITQAALQLQANGASLITTSCGFLGPLQARLQQQLSVPFIASSLALLPFLRMVYGTRRPIGVLTFDSRRLQAQHFMGHYDAQIRIAGIEQGNELHRVIAQNETVLDKTRAEQDVLTAAQQLTTHDVSCLLLECTNLSPYKTALRQTLNLPVYDLVDALHWVVQART